ILGVAEHCGDEVAGRVGRPARASLLRPIGLLVAGLLAAVQNLGAADQHTRIDTERPANETEDDDGADAKPAGSARYAKPAAKTAADIAIVFDIIAAAKIIPAHVSTPCGPRPPDDVKADIKAITTRGSI